MRRRRKQTRAQRRALATVLLMQRIYSAAHGKERQRIGFYMMIIARAAHEIDAFTVWDIDEPNEATS